ncbi:MAG: sugar phosphate isomerase/epimerase [Lentisphaerae bacterium]|jgi:D-psicose/D-tagatose/L-ribulose 3-epimerase|nr:sugar phosphate isomerase/epimerase [Lentisphaerota bacterium]MBT4817498.1 sugar phosphate isomerase/epimerase [Lentisphaerota bacterium]MBT5612988.1 sugar phosphate isomerase/epimerase [Lentisphaerota bacterium]MBT7059066.1 sugar phosphate isomerase/epimerase [Lentisphaerota bacterium]MBT7847092.1 sugar phosphate isomerase/epimerase [Lentisphaerota bacterium]
MRYGLNLLVHTAAFTTADVDLVQKAADLGYDGVEILFGDLSTLDAPATRSALESTGMGMTACCVMPEECNPCSEAAAVREAAVERLKAMIDITAEMGGEAIAGPLYSPVRYLTGKPCSNDEWNHCVDVLRAAASHAESSGIDMAIEPLNRFETYVINTVADAVRMCREVGSDRLKVQLDTFHANIEEKDTAASIRAAGNYIGHVHASESDRGVPGTGQVRWPEVFAALHDIGYDRWVTIESFATGIVDLCAAACIWRPIYDSAEGLARDGLAFLKESARLN